LIALGQNPNLENKAISLEIKLSKGIINLINRRYSDLIVDQAGTVEDNADYTDNQKTSKKGDLNYTGTSAY